jgi:hypothetical protein
VFVENGDEQNSSLHRFTETHHVPENAASIRAIFLKQPDHAIALVFPKVACNVRRHLRCRILAQHNRLCHRHAQASQFQGWHVP